MKTTEQYIIGLTVGIASIVTSLTSLCNNAIKATDYTVTPQVESRSAYFKSSGMEAPDQLKLIEHARENNLKLDSVYITERLGDNLEKRKWFFYYEGDYLKQREKQFYGETYEQHFDQKLFWTYDDQLNLILYEEYNKPIEGVDTVLRTNYTQYFYDQNLLTKEVEHTVTGHGASWGYDENGEIVIHEYEIRYRDSEYSYQYNTDNLLINKHWESVQEGQTITNSNSYDENYSYDEEGKLINSLLLQDDEPSMVYKYQYQTSDSLSQIIKYQFPVRSIPLAKLDIDALKVTTSTGRFEYTTFFDSQGRDSIYSYYEKPLHYSIAEKKIAFFYNEMGQLENEIYFLRLAELNYTEWYEQVHVNYTYDDDGNLINYEKIYYDLQYNKWLLLEEQDYFYSPLKSTTLNHEELKNTIKVFPNPAHDVINLSVNEGTYSILNYTGKTIVHNKTFITNIDVSNLVPGVYFIQINLGSEVEILRFLKE